ncbi:hypothetical protein LVJ94_42680 [Pendulispora rubella]|uniref:Uncharacterized protein n=1 Tax=Pendulispora rubella TaxID=2741070 RepID=A0ABZ2L4P1_9BACT
MATTLLAWQIPARPAADAGWLKACSFRHPLCVHAKPTTPANTVLTVLDETERAWDGATGPLALPPPDPSPTTGAYDVYLVDGASQDASTVLDERDPIASFDRASAFTSLDAHLTGCARTHAIARGLLRAITFRVSPNMDAGSAEAQTESLAHALSPCITPETTARATFQAHPERALPDAWPEFAPTVGMTYAQGASLFYDWMDDGFGQQPGSIVRAIWALSPGKTDTFEILRSSFKNALSSGSTLDDLLLGFAVGRVLPSAGIAPRTDWQIDWPAKPRRLAPRDPTAPTGSAYVVVRRAGAPPGARLRVEAIWEEHAKMRWSVVKLDAGGREIARIPVASAERATETQGSIVDLDATDTLVVVGTNAGDFTPPFDPDDAVWEPHGWRLTLAAE